MDFAKRRVEDHALGAGNKRRHASEPNGDPRRSIQPK